MYCLDGAAEVQSPVLAGVTYAGWNAMPPDGDLSPCIARSADVLRSVAEEAGKRQVTLCVEVLNRYEGFLLNTVREGHHFMSVIDSPHVKLNLDTYHMNIEEDDIAAALREAGDALSHLHCSDNNRKRPGLGHIPWSEVGKALTGINYSGWLVMECFVTSGDEVGRTSRTWRPLSDDRDIDARAGARVLRSLSEYA